MNVGAFGENFPYSNFHELNMDWIIKIAKDFLDQYTSIQQIISDGETSLQNLTATGLEQLQNKADALETALQAWYNEHSEDIAGQLANALADLNAWYTEHSADIAGQLNSALADLNAWYTQHSADIASELSTAISQFNTAATNKAAETIQTIPSDYTALYNQVQDIQTREMVTPYNLHWVDGSYLGADGDVVSEGTYSYTDEYIPIAPNSITIISTYITGNAKIVLYDSAKNVIGAIGTSANSVADYTINNPIVHYVRLSCISTAKTSVKITQNLNIPVIEALDGVQRGINVVQTWQKGYVRISNGSIDIRAGADYTHYMVIPVLTGEAYEIKAKTTSTIHAYILATAQGVVIEYSTEDYASPEMKIFRYTPSQDGIMYVSTFDDDEVYVKQIVDGSMNDVYANLEALKIEQNIPSWSAGWIGMSGGSIVSHAGAQYTQYMQLSVSKYDKFKIKASSTNVVHAYILADDNGVVITYSNEDYGTPELKEFDFTVTNDGILYVNSFETPEAYVKKTVNGSMEYVYQALEYCIPNSNQILIIGDSQTQRTGYPQKLESDLQGNYTVYHYGHGGASSIDMAYCYDAITIYANPFTIPATQDPAEITLYSDYAGLIGDGTAFGVQSLEGVNPCEIAGITGEISVTYDPDYSNKHYYFTRAEEGSETAVTRPAQIKTGMSNIQNNILVVWLGTNDSSEQGITVSELFNQLKDVIGTIINKNRTNKYIVMGLTSKYIFSDYAQVNKLLSRHFGYHFLDLADYILKYGLSDASITPTAQDETDIANGEMPTSLRADAVHFNSYGYDVIGDLLYKRGKTLGYWN